MTFPTHLSSSLSVQPLQKVNMASSTVRKARDSLLMDNKESSSTLSSQLVIQEEEGQQSPVLLVPCNAEDKVNIATPTFLLLKPTRLSSSKKYIMLCCQKW